MLESYIYSCLAVRPTACCYNVLVSHPQTNTYYADSD